MDFDLLLEWIEASANWLPSQETALSWQQMAEEALL